MVNSSPKWAVLMAALALVGVSLPGAAFAQVTANSSVDIERNNEIDQDIEQSQEACTNEAVSQVADNDVVDIGGENSVDVEQSNDCDVTQSQSASSSAVIVDESENNIKGTDDIII